SPSRALLDPSCVVFRRNIVIHDFSVCALQVIPPEITPRETPRRCRYVQKDPAIRIKPFNPFSRKKGRVSLVSWGGFLGGMAGGSLFSLMQLALHAAAL